MSGDDHILNTGLLHFGNLVHVMNARYLNPAEEVKHFNITPPPVIWAQRSSVILLTICLEDCTDPEIKIENDKVYFKGIGGSKKTHEVTINLYKEIIPNKSLHCVRDRNIEFILKKKEEGPFWPQLTKEKVKHHWLKVDFNKWKDEDDSDDGETRDSDLNIEDMMRQMAGLGGSGDNKSKWDDLDMNDGADSDDNDLPDLE